jgi:hypothetical protein
MRQPTNPVKVFTDVDEAKAWCRRLLNGEAVSMPPL